MVTEVSTCTASSISCAPPVIDVLWCISRNNRCRHNSAYIYGCALKRDCVCTIHLRHGCNTVLSRRIALVRWGVVCDRLASYPMCLWSYWRRFIRTHHVQARELEYVGSIGLGVGGVIESAGYHTHARVWSCRRWFCSRLPFSRDGVAAVYHYTEILQLSTILRRCCWRLPFSRDGAAAAYHSMEILLQLSTILRRCCCFRVPFSGDATVYHSPEM